ncbi:unnamed protein product [Anisakis simplex]|uniref:FACT complex subunit n=1 Tax=Anisakis simplex TaxID=6269 RepID=A0A0M3JEJ7_ANISI|nr:unnamed protein product [Anisakis simplex]
MKTILDDPEDFFKNGGWNFLAADSDNEDEEEDEESEEAWTPSEEESEGEDEDEDEEESGEETTESGELDACWVYVFGGCFVVFYVFTSGF